MKPIVLTTLNARYSHASIGLRYLFANLHELQEKAVVAEFVINENVQAIAEKILAHRPAIVGIGVYIWNASDVHALIGILKKVSPHTVIVLGGPEAGYLPHRTDFSAADYIVQGEGETVFYALCKKILDGVPPAERFIKAPLADLNKIALPYAYYDENDVANRYVYVEASRGCPFLCEFCLSAIDEKVRNFDIDRLIAEFGMLWERGVRTFKFIDRTFNLNIRFANRILDFFLAKEPPYFVHFEVIPDHFPDTLKERIARFPAGALQLEVGIQTLDPEVARRIERPLKVEKIARNLEFLENNTRAHMHLDLIVGLPGESLEGFGRNLDTLVSQTRSEIQIGILKKLSGTTLERHDEAYGMLYSDEPPYDVLQNDLLPFETIQKMKRFARFWDLTYNSGNFNRTVRMIWEEGRVFKGFWHFSEWIYGRTASTWKISLQRLAELLFEYLTTEAGRSKEASASALAEDLAAVGGRGLPPFLRPYVKAASVSGTLEGLKGAKRQQRHT